MGMGHGKLRPEERKGGCVEIGEGMRQKMGWMGDEMG